MSPRTGVAFRAASLFLVTVVLVTVAFPLTIAVADVVAGLARSNADAPQAAVSWRSFLTAEVLVSSLAWPLGIGLGSMFLAWPAAWMIRRFGARLLPWVLVPLTVPTYLAYAGYGLVRAPGTWLGDWLERAAHESWPSAPFIAGQVLAFIGMCLWAWPIPALVIGLAASKVDDSILDSLSIDRASFIRRQWFLVSLLRRPIAVSIALVALILLGSAVPLHLSQVPAWSIKLWFAIDNTPADQRWRVWVLSLPVVAVAVLASLLIARTRVHDEVLEPAARRRVVGVGVLAAAAVLLASTVGPLACFAGSIRQPASLAEFWRTSRAAVGWTGLVALHVAAVGLFVCLSVWYLASGAKPSKLVRLAVVALTGAGLVPGVLLGAAVNMAWLKWEQTRPVADSYWVIILAHVARFGWVPAWIGLLLAAAEPRERRHHRLVDGAVGLAGWWSAAARPGIGIAAGAAIFAGLLSVHEIESTVLVQPPGVDGLARQILQFLHFSRMEELSAASVWMIGGGLAMAVLAAWVVYAAGSRSNRASPNLQLPTVNES